MKTVTFGKENWCWYCGLHFKKLIQHQMKQHFTCHVTGCQTQCLTAPSLAFHLIHCHEWKLEDVLSFKVNKGTLHHDITQDIHGTTGVPKQAYQASAKTSLTSEASTSTSTQALTNGEKPPPPRKRGRKRKNPIPEGKELDPHPEKTETNPDMENGSGKSDTQNELPGLSVRIKAMPSETGSCKQEEKTPVKSGMKNVTALGSRQRRSPNFYTPSVAMLSTENNILFPSDLLFEESGEEIDLPPVHKKRAKSPDYSPEKPVRKRRTKSSESTEKSVSAIFGKRKFRCGECETCLSADCRSCRFCLDMSKYGGRNVLRQACIKRRCLNRQKAIRKKTGKTTKITGKTSPKKQNSPIKREKQVKSRTFNKKKNSKDNDMKSQVPVRDRSIWELTLDRLEDGAAEPEAEYIFKSEKEKHEKREKSMRGCNMMLQGLDDTDVAQNGKASTTNVKLDIAGENSEMQIKIETEVKNSTGENSEMHVNNSENMENQDTEAKLTFFSDEYTQIKPHDQSEVRKEDKRENVESLDTSGDNSETMDTSGEKSESSDSSDDSKEVEVKEEPPVNPLLTVIEEVPICISDTDEEDKKDKFTFLQPPTPMSKLSGISQKKLPTNKDVKEFLMSNSAFIQFLDSRKKQQKEEEPGT